MGVWSDGWMINKTLSSSQVSAVTERCCDSKYRWGWRGKSDGTSNHALISSLLWVMAYSMMVSWHNNHKHKRQSIICLDASSPSHLVPSWYFCWYLMSVNITWRLLISVDNLSLLLLFFSSGPQQFIRVRVARCPLQNWCWRIPSTMDKVKYQWYSWCNCDGYHRSRDDDDDVMMIGMIMMTLLFSGDE